MSGQPGSSAFSRPSSPRHCLGASRSTAKPPTLTDLFPPGAASRPDGRRQSLGDLRPLARSRPGSRAEGSRSGPRRRRESSAFVVAADAAPGLRWVRLYDEEGATTLRPFVVGVLPEVVEVEPNDEPKAPQRLATASATVNGRLAKAGDVDGFAVKSDPRPDARRRAWKRINTSALRWTPSSRSSRPRGSSWPRTTTISAATRGSSSKHPRQGRTSFVSSPSPQRPIAASDSRGPTTSSTGSPLTTGGFLDYAFPLAVGQDGPGTVEAIGWNIPADARRWPISGLRRPRRIRPSSIPRWPARPRFAGFLSPRRSRPSPMTWRGPKRSRARSHSAAGSTRRATRTSSASRCERTTSACSASSPAPWAGRSIRSSACSTPAARSWPSLDDTGRNSRDLERSFTAPADGEYRLVVRDLNGRGRSSIRLSLERARAASGFRPHPGGRSVRPDAGEADQDHRGDPAQGRRLLEPIEIVAEDLPPGITAEPPSSKPGDASARSVTLELTADKGGTSGPLRIVGKATREPRTSRMATAPIVGPGARTEWLWATILQARIAKP